MGPSGRIGILEVTDFQKTSWALIRGAAAGEHQAGEEFARRYAPVVRAYLMARWQDSGFRNDLEDAVQQVFIECFKQGGALGRADPDWPGGFRKFLFGVVRNVALMAEKKNRKLRGTERSGDLHEEGLQDTAEMPDQAFDRAWARSLVREALARQADRAAASGQESVRRFEILRLRFQNNMPIRDIATLWDIDRDHLHHEYAKAREEFKAALREVLALEKPGSSDEIERLLSEVISVLG